MNPILLGVVIWYALLIVYIIYREIRAALEMSMHVNKDGILVNGYKTGLGGKVKQFDEREIYL